MLNAYLLLFYLYRLFCVCVCDCFVVQKFFGDKIFYNSVMCTKTLSASMKPRNLYSDCCSAVKHGTVFTLGDTAGLCGPRRILEKYRSREGRMMNETLLLVGGLFIFNALETWLKKGKNVNFFVSYKVIFYFFSFLSNNNNYLKS